MKRWTRRDTDVLLAWLVGVAAIAMMAMALTGCAPTAPSEDAIRYNFEPTVEETAFTESEFDIQRDCVGAESRTAEVTINVHDGWFDCGGVAANGCLQTVGSIHVNRRVYAPAVSHELIHLWEAKLGHALDYGHTGAVWAKCDRLNREGVD